MALGALVQKFASDGSLKTLIKSRFKTVRETPFLTADGYIRASSFADLCPREEVLRHQHKIMRKETQQPGSLLTLVHGTALHWGVQNHILPQIQVLLGKWKCLECGKVYGGWERGDSTLKGLIERPEECGACQTKNFQYEEHYFKDEEYRITGHPDGFIKVPGLPGIGILEVKSVGSHSAWEIRRTPNYGHMVQTHIYMWMTGFAWAKILYWEKGVNGMDALTEYHIDRCEETVQEIKATLRSVWDGIASGILPERICANNKCPRAEACSVTKHCFKPEMPW